MMKAPKYVIDELDRWAADEHNECCISGLLEDISAAYYAENSIFSTLTAQWVYKNNRTPSEDLPYEYAVIEHVFGGKRLEEE